MRNGHIIVRSVLQSQLLLQILSIKYHVYTAEVKVHFCICFGSTRSLLYKIWFHFFLLYISLVPTPHWSRIHKSKLRVHYYLRLHVALGRYSTNVKYMCSLFCLTTILDLLLQAFPILHKSDTNLSIYTLDNVL